MKRILPPPAVGVNGVNAAVDDGVPTSRASSIPSIIASAEVDVSAADVIGTICASSTVTMRLA
jgi:hypothetical protein